MEKHQRRVLFRQAVEEERRSPATSSARLAASSPVTDPQHSCLTIEQQEVHPRSFFRCGAYRTQPGLSPAGVSSMRRGL